MEVAHAHGSPKEKHFKHYLYEFFMMFLAVFTGFIAENIRENYLEHKKAGEYAVLLKNDLMTDTSQLDNFIRQKDTFNKMVTDANNLHDKPRDEITIQDLREMDNTSFSTDYFISNDVTITQLKNSGALRYFADPDLVIKLGLYEWYIKKFNDLHNQISSMYGGISSEHILQYDIQLDKFLKKTIHFDSSVTAAKAGYGFQEWDENFKIIQLNVEFLSMYNELTYPEIKNQAAEIIGLLNKEYHLK